MLEKEIVENIALLTKNITSTTIDQLISNTSNWGSINFELARQDLELIYSLCNHLNSLPISILPQTVADKIVQSLTSSSTAITKIKDFNIESGTPTSVRDSIVSEIKTNAENLLNITKDWIPFLAYQKGDVQKNIEELSKAVKSAESILTTSKGKTEESKKEIEGIITAAREASASVGVAVFTSDFDGQADKLELVAKDWLKYTVGIAFITVILAFIFLFVPISATSTKAQILQYMTSKLVLFIVLITALVWTGRIYKALKHQVTVNRFKANSLKTFQAFIKAAEDESTRSAVLLETTASIFSNSSSGYLDNADTASDSNKRVYEIVKSVSEINKF